MAPESVISIKQSFLAAQTRHLAQPLAPSRAWRAANESAEDGLTERALDEAMLRTNQLLLQHERRVHPPQAIRHVAEQIDNMYWKAGERAVLTARQDDDNSVGGGGVIAGVHWRDAGADLANPEVIASLPPAWTSQRDVAAFPVEVKRYSELAEQLQSLAAQKEAAAAKVTRLRRMRDALEPFDGVSGDGAEGGNGVQENLVTRNGEMEREMERMRILLLRVGARVDRLGDSAPDGQRGEGGTEVDDLGVTQRKKVEGLLDNL